MSDPHDPRQPPRSPPAGGFGGAPGPQTPLGPATGPSEAGMGFVAADGTAQRGGCLTAFLVLMLIANPLTACVYLLGSAFIKRGMPHAPDWAAPVMGVMALAHTACAFGIWRWKKWGVVGSLAIAGVTLIMNFVIGVPPATAIFGLSGPIILIALVKPLWRAFR